jgi:hypothetical protein
VFLPLHAPWRDRYIAEHSAFPKGKHDDAVDQQSQALLYWKTAPVAREVGISFVDVGHVSAPSGGASSDPMLDIGFSRLDRF